MALGTRHLQRELTREVENRRALALKRLISLLPAGDPRRESFEECVKDPVMRRCVDSYPGHGHVLSNVDFIDNTADYFGLDIPCCVRSAHMGVPGARGADKFVGRRGAALMSATSKGDGWRIQHNSAQHFMWRALNDHGVRSQIERYGVFGDVFDDLHRARPDLWDEMSPSTRHGAVPDIGANFAGKAELLLEVKTMHENPSCYPACSNGGVFRAPGVCPCANCMRRLAGAKPVEIRAGQVNKQVGVDLKKIEQELGHREEGGGGPLQRRLTELGGVTPLVAGAFGGVNAAWHTLNLRFAEAKAEKVWYKMLCTSVKQCKGVLLLHHQRKLCITLAGARSRLRHSLLQSLNHGVGGGHKDVDHQARKNARCDTARYHTCGGHGRNDSGFAFAAGLFPS